MKRKNSSRMKSLFILIPLLIVIIFVCYYHLYWKSPQVNSGTAKLEKVLTGHKGVIWKVEFSPDASLLVSGSVDSTVKVWKIENEQAHLNLKNPSGVTNLDISNNGKYVAVTGYDGKIRIWEMSNGTLVKTLAGHNGTSWSIAFSPDDKWIVSGGEDNMVRLWDVQTGELLRTMKGHTLNIWSVKFSPDSKKIISTGFDKTIKIWNSETGELIWDHKAHSEAIVELAIAPDGKSFASCSDDLTIKFWDINTGKLLSTLEGSKEHVQGLAFSPDGKRLMSSGRDKSMFGELLQNFIGDSKFNKGVSARMWDLGTGKIIQTFSAHSNDANDVAWSSDGKWIATGSADKTIHLWRVN
jgi:WD40 repeat protein